MSRADTGKAILFMGAGNLLKAQQFPVPKNPSPGELLVRTTMSTVCGSDLQSWKGRRPFPVPAILGHEVVGTIVAQGEGADRDTFGDPLSCGDRIIWTLISSCGTCLYCRIKGLPQKCLKLFKYGHVRSDIAPYFTGGFAEFVYIRAGTCCFKVPAEMADEEAAPLSCAAATAAAGIDAVGDRIYGNVVIQGAGMLGFYSMALVKDCGSRRVIVIDIREDRLRIARDFGADYTINARERSGTSVMKEVMNLTGGDGADLVIEVSGDRSVIPIGMKMLCTGGEYILLGALYPESLFQVDAHDVITKNLRITGIHNYDARHLGRALRFVSHNRDRYPFRSLVGPRFPLSVEGVTAALRALESGASVRPCIVP